MTIFGWDMSNWDSPSIGDAVAEGFSFFTHKAGGDTQNGDQELKPWWDGVKNTDPAKVLLGTYWVPRPDMYSNPLGEVGRWLDRLDSQCAGWRERPHIFQVDAEMWNGNPATKPGFTYLKTMCVRLTQVMPKLRPIVYAPQWTYGDSLTGLGFPLWASHYVSGSGYASQLYPGDQSSYWGAYSGQTPAILQFTSSATIAGQTTCDANAYRGTLAELTALVAPGWEVPDVNLTDQYGDAAWPQRTVQNRLKDDAMLRDLLWGDPQGTKVALPLLPPSSPLAAMMAAPAKLDALSKKVDAQAATLAQIQQAVSSGVSVDPNAIATAIEAAVAKAVAQIAANIKPAS